MERARVVVIAGARGSSERSNSEGDSKAAGVVASVENGNRGQGEGMGNPWTAPWRFSTELPRAGLATVISGVGYLLYAFPGYNFSGSIVGLLTFL